MTQAAAEGDPAYQRMLSVGRHLDLQDALDSLP